MLVIAILHEAQNARVVASVAVRARSVAVVAHSRVAVARAIKAKIIATNLLLFKLL